MSTISDDSETTDESIDVEHPHRDEGLLRYLYDERGVSGTKIATILDCTPATVYNWLRRRDIEIDDTSAAVPSSGPDHPKYDPIDREILVELHTERGLSPQQVADELGRSQTTVRKYLYVHEVPPPQSDGDTFHGSGNPNTS